MNANICVKAEDTHAVSNVKNRTREPAALTLTQKPIDDFVPYADVEPGNPNEAPTGYGNTLPSTCTHFVANVRCVS